MSALIERHGAPDPVRSDNGSDFIENGFRREFAEKRIKTLYLQNREAHGRMDTWRPSTPISGKNASLLARRLGR
ncbi:MAG: hypothetical protein ACI92G_000676 [Candidatus Pelagisphaera sp.]|jgi:hypothetical protein